MKTMILEFKGIRPLIMHNGQLADPMNPASKAMKVITLKPSKKKTDTDFAQLARLEWEASLYWSKENGLIIPSDNLEKCLQDGARKKSKGKDVQAAVFCTEPEAKINYQGPTTIEKLYADPSFHIRKGVKIGQNRVIRSRPMIPTGWSVTFEVEFDDEIVNKDTVQSAAIDAGALVGLGDWRPKFGRFIVTFG